MTARAEKIFELQRMPLMSVEILRSALARTRHRDVSAALPRWEVRVVLARVDHRRLAAYRAVCGFTGDARLPILYPQVLATPLHLHLMTRRGFPFPPGRLLPVANRFEQSRPLDAGESLALSARLQGARHAAGGIEFDIITQCTDVHGHTPWLATMTLLYPATAPAAAVQGGSPAELPRLGRYIPLDVPADIGRRYAHAAQDFNPLHLSGPTARLLGRRRPLAPHMWLAAHCIAQLPAPRDGWLHCRLRFLRPLAVPAQPVLRVCGPKDSPEFALLGEDGAMLLEGRLGRAKL